jgi:hypothetical protein
VVVVRNIVALEVTMHGPPAMMSRFMVRVGVQMDQGGGHRAHLRGEAHEQNEGQAFHGMD